MKKIALALKFFFMAGLLFADIEGGTGNAKVPGTKFLDKNLSNGASHRFPIRVHSCYSW